MKKTLAKITKKIADNPLETITIVSVATAVSVLAYYQRGTVLKVTASDLKRFERRPNAGLIFEIKGKDYVLHNYLG